MKKWEYLTHISPSGMYNHELNKLGDDGWELISVTVEQGQGTDPPVWHQFFKREKHEEANASGDAEESE